MILLVTSVFPLTQPSFTQTLPSLAPLLSHTSTHRIPGAKEYTFVNKVANFVFSRGQVVPVVRGRPSYSLLHAIGPINRPLLHVDMICLPFLSAVCFVS